MGLTGGLPDLALLLFESREGRAAAPETQIGKEFQSEEGGLLMELHCNLPLRAPG